MSSPIFRPFPRPKKARELPGLAYEPLPPRFVGSVGPCYHLVFRTFSSGRVAPTSRPHRPEAQDVALSRPKHGFESRWGRYPFPA